MKSNPVFTISALALIFMTLNLKSCGFRFSIGLLRVVFVIMSPGERRKGRERERLGQKNVESSCFKTSNAILEETSLLVTSTIMEVVRHATI